MVKTRNLEMVETKEMDLKLEITFGSSFLCIVLTKDSLKPLDVHLVRYKYEKCSSVLIQFPYLYFNILIKYSNLLKFLNLLLFFCKILY